MEKLREILKSVRIPQAGDRVYKDECVISFDTPVSLTVNICLV